jgi:acyl-CoA thioester hydrolase
MIQFEYRTKVYYKDVDQMGIVYYARYYEYFEAARTELLKSLGIRVTVIENEGYLLPVITSHCDYKVGANFEDTLVINTIIKDQPKSRLRIDYEIHRDNSDELLVSGYTLHAFTDKSGKAVKPPKQLLEILKQNL